MSSEMRECPFCGNGAWVVRVPDTRRFRPQCKKCGADLGEFDREADAVAAWNRRALLARTEAGADGAVAWLCEWTDEDDGETVRVSFEFKRGAENRALEVGGDARVIPLYTHPQDASGDAVDWKWQYRYQTVMRFMDNGATREAAERAALIDIAELENAAMQAKEAK